MAQAMAPEAVDAEVAGQILGISRTTFKEGVARTTIRLYEGATPLTLIEEKLEGDASLMMRNPGTRAWLLEALRDVERKTGSTLFRTGDDAQVTDNDIKEAWSHLGQGYFVGRSKKGDDQMLASWKQKGFRQVYADILSSKAGPAMQAYGTFFRSVWRRGAELNGMRRAGTLDADLEGALRRSLGMSDGKSALLTDDQSITQGTVNNRAQAGIELKPGQKLREEDGVSFAVTPVPFADNVEAAVRGKLAANAILDMGRPGEVLRKAGVPDLPMWLRLSKVRKKRGKHSELTEEVMKKFPEAMDNPMLVYVSPWDRKAHSIVTSLATSQGPLTAYFTVHEREGQQVLEAKTLFGKEPQRLLAEIREAESKGLITHKNKEAFESWLSAQGDGAGRTDASTQHNTALEGLKEVFHETDGSQPNASATGTQSTSQDPSETSFSIGPRPSIVRLIDKPTSDAKLHGDEARNPKAIFRALTGGELEPRESHARRGQGTVSGQRRKHGRTLVSVADFVAWADAHGRNAAPEEFSIKDFEATGGEHLVFFDGVSGRAVKITKPGLVGAQGEDVGAYIQRWMLANEAFRDDVTIEGIVSLPGEHAPRVIISQPFRKGRDATDSEIRSYLRERGFHEHEGRWLHPIRGIKVWDTITPGNVIITAKGPMAVDLQVEPASSEDLHAVREKTGFGKGTSFSLLPGSPDGTSSSGSQHQPRNSPIAPGNLPATSTNIDSTLPIPYVQQHGQGTERRRDAQAALRALLARAEADAGANARADAAQRIRAESESLVSWSRESGWLIEPAGFTGLIDTLEGFEGGAEHEVFGVPEKGRVLKLTRPPNFGARGELPSYLKNIKWSNALFHDDIRIEGVIETEDGPAVVISQPYIEGRSPEPGEVIEWFEKQGYVPAGENTWRHPDTGAVVADAHKRNFIMTDANELVPIDLQVLNPGKDILEQEKREQQ